MTKVLPLASVVALATLSLACVESSGRPARHWRDRSVPPAHVIASPLQIATVADPTPKEIRYLKCSGKEARSGDVAFCFDEQERSFLQAETHCQEIGGHLAAPATAHEAMAMRAAFGTPFDLPNSLWIGLVEPFKEGEWGWMSGKRATYQSWAGGEPNDAGGGEDCAERLSVNGLWNDLDCGASRPFLCEGPSPSARPAGKAKSSFTCTGTAFEAGETPYCVYPNGSLNAAQAEQFCKSTGGHLAELSTPEKDKALLAALGPRVGSGNHVWVGLTDFEREGEWRTMTGEVATFTTWRAGEPNNVGGNENCAIWGPSDGLWNDVPCGIRAESICQGLIDPATQPDRPPIAD